MWHRDCYLGESNMKATFMPDRDTRDLAQYCIISREILEIDRESIGTPNNNRQD